MANINLKFKGDEYTISENKAFEVGEAVEDVLTISEIAAMSENPKFFKIAKCFGVMLRFAGAKVSDKEVHSEMMREVSALGDDAEEAKTLLAAQAMHSLMAVLMDGAPLDEDEGETPEKT